MINFCEEFIDISKIGFVRIDLCGGGETRGYVI